jgi:hypothetical protein
MKLPRTSVQGFELLGRSLYGLRRAFRITDTNSLLQALEWVLVGAEQSLEEANVVCGHGTPPYHPPTHSRYGECRVHGDWLGGRAPCFHSSAAAKETGHKHDENSDQPHHLGGSAGDHELRPRTTLILPM